MDDFSSSRSTPPNSPILFLPSFQAIQYNDSQYSSSPPSSSSTKSSSSSSSSSSEMMMIFPPDPPSPWPWPPPQLPSHDFNAHYDRSPYNTLLLDDDNDDHDPFLHIFDLENDHKDYLRLIHSNTIQPLHIYPCEASASRSDSRMSIINDAHFPAADPAMEDQTTTHHLSHGAAAPLTIPRGHGLRNKVMVIQETTTGASAGNSDYSGAEEEKDARGIAEKKKNRRSLKKLDEEEEEEEEVWKRMKKRRNYEDEQKKKKLKKLKETEEEEEEIRTRASTTKTTSDSERERERERGREEVVHVRARRGEATDSHSLAERIRREKINRRMKLLQDLVPNCNKVLGKAAALEEIINYVKSLQCQIEFLSIRLAQSNPTTILGGQIIRYKPQHM